MPHLQRYNQCWSIRFVPDPLIAYFAVLKDITKIEGVNAIDEIGTISVPRAGIAAKRGSCLVGVAALIVSSSRHSLEVRIVNAITNIRKLMMVATHRKYLRRLKSQKCSSMLSSDEPALVLCEGGLK